MNGKQRPLNWFFYLAPVWFLVETFIWPGFRAGLVTGGNAWGTVIFYSVEAGIGAAIWYELPYAETGALIENVVYLIFVLKFILFAPWDMALAIDGDTAGAVRTAAGYRASLPGMLYSRVYLVLKIKNKVSAD